LGKFIALISFLPVVFLSPFALIYWLQYLGRVLVSSAMGDTRPPRSPDRNFDGLFNGLSPWFIWFVLGVLVGLVPLFWYRFSTESAAELRWPISVGLTLLGLPYILMSLLMSFVHDDPIAAKPWVVIGAVLRVAASFTLLSGFIAAALGLAIGAFALTLSLRAGYFWLYLPTCLICWVVMLWIAIAWRL
jgi:hypothetical protein